MSRTWQHWRLALAVLLLYLALRLASLTGLPVFFDEAVHLRWAKLLWRGQMLTAAADGRLLFIWWVGVFWPFVETLWLGRVVMVLALLPGVAALIAAGRELGNRSAGLLAGVLLAVLPVALFYDRMVLADTVQAAMTSMLVWLGIRLAHQARPIEIVLTAGVMLALPLTKVLGLFFVLTPALMVLTQLRRDPIAPERPWRTVWPVGLAGGLFAVGFGVALAVLRWRGVDFLSLAQNNAGAFDVAGLPIRLVGHLRDYVTLVGPYFGGWALPLALIGLAGLARLLYQRAAVALGLVAASAVPLLAMATLVGPFEVRYLLPGLPPLVLAAALGLAHPTPERWRPVGLTATGLAALLALPLVWQICAAPLTLTGWLPEKDIAQYLTGWTAGSGVPELAAALQAYAVTAPTDVVVLDEGMIPMLSTYLGDEPSLRSIYVYEEPNLRLLILYPGLDDPFAGLADPARQVFLLAGTPLHDARMGALAVTPEVEVWFPKASGPAAYVLYQVWPVAP